MKSLIFSIFIFLGMAVSCNTTQKRETSLDNTWLLKSLDGQTIPNFEKETQPTLELNLSEKHFYGSNGCNNIFGDINDIGDSELVFGEIATTQMACPDMTFSFKFNELLKEVRSYSISEDNTLVLYGDNNKVLMEYILQEVK